MSQATATIRTQVITTELAAFRSSIEREAGEDLYRLSIDATIFLRDLCQHYGLSKAQTATVLGEANANTVETLQCNVSYHATSLPRSAQHRRNQRGAPAAHVRKSEEALP